MVVLPATDSSVLTYPTELITNTAFSGTVIEKFPLASVVVPSLEPFTNTDVPDKGSPASPVTRPVTLLSCPNTVNAENAKKTKN